MGVPGGVCYGTGAGDEEIGFAAPGPRKQGSAIGRIGPSAEFKLKLMSKFKNTLAR